MPIISISLSESLKSFINKLVSKNQYENKSKLIRDALLRLMSDVDISALDTPSEFLPDTKNITGNMIIVAPNDTGIQKRLNKIENEFRDEIVSKNQFFDSKFIQIFMVFEGKLQDFQKIVLEINGIKEVKNFRYLIIN